MHVDALENIFYIMLSLLQGNAVSYDEGDHHSRRDFRRREEDDRERRGDDRWREREEERRMGGGSREEERGWGRTEGKAGPSFATYTPIWSAVPSRCDSS
jgi:hypothetical protein